MLIAGCALLAVAARRLERVLPPYANGLAANGEPAEADRASA
jgi:hypothetical protein